MPKDIFFSSSNLDLYLKELAKEYRRISGKHMPAEVVLVGGAAILAEYGFRENTQDIDACIKASSAMKEAADRVRDKYDLADKWFNSDFENTDSYSPKLLQYSKYYKTFSNIVEFRIITAEYLVAMKLIAGRAYKHDLSDAGEILLEHWKRNEPISKDRVLVALNNLYGDFSRLPPNSEEFLQAVFETNTREELEAYVAARKESEQEVYTALRAFDSKYKGALTETSLGDVLEHIQMQSHTFDTEE